MTETCATASAETNNTVPWSGLVAMVETNLSRCFEQLVGGKTAVDIHKDNLARFRDRWQDVQNSNICLCCLRRRPQYGLPCGH